MIMETSYHSIIGMLVVTYAVYKFFTTITSFLSLYVFPRFGLRTNPKKYGEWAVVTGSTDGIGKSYSKELAKAGMNLVLVSRSRDKLEQTKEEILSLAKVQIKTVAFDYSKVDGYEDIEAELHGLDIGILVNNVGASYEFPEFTNLYEDKDMERLVTINCVSAMKMTKLVLGGMLTRKRGIVVSVTSFCSQFPFPLLNVYSASKIFVDYFTRSLRYEYPGTGVDFQVVCPMYVATKMSGMRPGLASPSSDVYARSALGTLGLAPFTFGYWFHDITSQLFAILPTFVSIALFRRSLLAIRKKAIRRREKKKM